MKLKIAFLLFYCSLSLFAQSEDEYVNSSEDKYFTLADPVIPDVNDFKKDTTEKAFDWYFFSDQNRCFEDVEQRLISYAKKEDINEWMYNMNLNLPDSVFIKLTPKEYFVFATQFPENHYSRQSCFVNKSDDKKVFKVNKTKILPYLEHSDDVFLISERQSEMLNKYRDNTVFYLKECLENKKNISNEFRRLILKIECFEIIPKLIEILKKQKKPNVDQDILTLFCLLMKDDYKPFKESQIYKDLYVIDDSVEFNKRTLRDRTIPFTWKNYNQIVKFAEDYYQFKTSN
ncbi:hypothetical protein [Aureivirga sp. CE67]|uniref:hypothetical protein n=1 Tax=Aureivirga sp. CE67 TaxID=1788983 RepID=UPI0018C9925C|nr:hypothetical protein [Aureivirga sp. CE67]